MPKHKLCQNCANTHCHYGEHEYTKTILDHGCDNFQEKPRKKTLKIRFKKFNPAAVAPRQGTHGSAGFDLTAIEMEETKKYLKYDTGLSFEIPLGYVGLLFPRSSICRTGLALVNSVGVLDSDYRGSVSFVFYKEWPQAHGEYKPGDRIGQLVIVPIPAVEYVESNELSDTERGIGGYGSTGK